MYDLLLKGGRVIDPDQGLDATMDVAFAGGKVAALGADLGQAARELRHVAGRIVTPGLIDMHSHVYWGGTSLGVDAETIAKRSGTTTFVDAGSAGAGNFAGLRKFIVEPAAPRILAYLNISFPGIFAFSKNVMMGECEDLRLLDSRECLALAEQHLDLIVGIKARVGARAGGSSGLAPLLLAIEVAEELDLPVMAHIDFPPPGRKEVLDALRPGDVLTHCFRPFPNAPVTRGNRIREDILEAHRRGIIFDIGHGFGGFAFKSARPMLAEGILPDVISSDVHVLCCDGPAHDVLAVMSKFMALGMSLTEVIRATTQNPARALRRPELGSLKPGTPGDATVLELAEGRFEHVDVSGEVIVAETGLVSRGMVLRGKWWSEGGEG
ncbi:amidohydrolase/deacetylase family metallohydrolase [Tabrizicola oligotrophica]|uniref:Amidohydrolase/deacetylase family metallohydrolase n=1 Tax=Tabrizicola oligotrophica TaxID=2710650 RepID=A0A6M0QUW3_9RHOB|nr:amidohydrolase/deacetylase family metallohydrolase [Tabrizicola oligotrophica]NEY90634.1 amidohydrolase/deacetylase family metallohydrolase [Tabrizicola oligotrophica]